MSFFKQFPEIDLDVQNNGLIQKAVDIYRLVDVNDALYLDSVSYTDYNIIDGARPDIISQLLYDTPEYYWTFFIVNDHLKDGYKAWPKSEVGFEKYIKRKYQNDLFVEFTPLYDSYDTTISKQFSMNDYPLNQYLSVYNDKEGSSKYSERVYFKHYDVDTNQLIFRKVNPRDFSNLENNNNLNTYNLNWFEFVNPYNVYSDEYASVELIRTQYNRDVYNWFTNSLFGNDYIQSIESEIPNLANLVVGTDDYYSAFMSILEGSSTYTLPTSSLKSGASAPHHYTNIDGDIITAFQANHAGYPEQGISSLNANFGDAGFVTNYEYEKDLNDKASSIKVIRPSKIQEFARRFKELINE